MKKNIIYVDFMFSKKRLISKFDFLIYKINLYIRNYFKTRKNKKDIKNSSKSSLFKKVL